MCPAHMDSRTSDWCKLCLRNIQSLLCIRVYTPADCQCNARRTSRLHGHWTLYIGCMGRMVTVCMDFVWLSALLGFTKKTIDNYWQEVQRIATRKTINCVWRPESLSVNVTYLLVLRSRQLMDFQWNHANTCSMVNDWPHSIRHSSRTCQCMDWHIFD